MRLPRPTADVGLPAAVFVAVGLCHALVSPVGEPFKGGDETRHVMTGVFVRDALYDLPASARDPAGYAGRYYAQYPALGLLVWPPAFYLAEGAAMAAFGTGYLTARLTVYAFAFACGLYAYRLALRTHGREVAVVALATLGLSPAAFDFSGYVLLEVPTMALIMASVFHFERYLTAERGRDALLACVLAALAALTRFNGVLLLPYVLFRLVGTRKLHLLSRRPVVAGVLVAVALTLPYYLFTWRVYGAGVEQAAVSGTNAGATGLFAPVNFALYPSFLPDQLRWPVVLLALLGMGSALARGRAAAGPHFALVAATYFAAVPFAEPLPRHAIYWLPAVGTFAGVGAVKLARRAGRWVGFAATVGAVGFAGGVAVTWAGWHVRGNEDAADYVVAHASGDRPVLVDGDLNGAFIYYVRRADPERRLWVLRGDKVLYAVMSDPHGRLEEYAKTDAEVLAALHRYDPEFVVVEEPQLLFDLPAAARLRAVLRAHPERFRLERVVPFRGDHHLYKTARLEIYRKLDRNPDPDRAVAVPVLGLGRSVGAAR